MENAFSMLDPDGGPAAQPLEGALGTAPSGGASSEQQMGGNDTFEGRSIFSLDGGVHTPLRGAPGAGADEGGWKKEGAPLRWLSTCPPVRHRHLDPDPVSVFPFLPRPSACTHTLFSRRPVRLRSNPLFPRRDARHAQAFHSTTLPERRAAHARVHQAAGSGHKHRTRL